MQIIALAAFSLATLAGLLIARTEPAEVQEQQQQTEVKCTIDLSRRGQMEDVLSNALMHAYGIEESRVQKYLEAEVSQCPDGPALLRKTAGFFDLEPSHLEATVERFRHVNCKHPHAPIAELEALKARAASAPGSVRDVSMTAFAADVTLHVVLHELGHALVREFDLPIFGNEETLADAFATHYLVSEMPERAPAVLRARVASLLFEAAEVPREEWTVAGEHNNDARRACQIAALAIAADGERFAHVADLVGMSDDQRRSAIDYGAEIHRSWRRVLTSLRMPAGLESQEARVTASPSMQTAPESRQLLADLERALRGFDWHSQVTLAFVDGDGGAGWSRSKRTITVNSGYVARFVRQGTAIESE
ncbi:MAG: DUF4344 domain-containing metallopeptidase [Planctomycetota bacterium]